MSKQKVIKRHAKYKVDKRKIEYALLLRNAREKYKGNQ